MSKPCSVTAGILENESGYTIPLDSPQWQEWLNNAQSFRYCPTSDNAAYTARREKLYWYAYRKQQGKLHKRYLGKAEELTLERLEHIAELLNTTEQLRPTQPKEVTETEEEVTQYVTREELQLLHIEIAALRKEMRIVLEGKS